MNLAARSLAVVLLLGTSVAQIVPRYSGSASLEDKMGFWFQEIVKSMQQFEMLKPVESLKI